MKNLLVKLGKIKSSLLIVSISVITSFIMTLLISYTMIYFNYNINIKASILLSIIVPLLIASPISWYCVGLMLEIHRLKEELEKLANYDSLTNLLTRRAFIFQTKNSIEIAKRKEDYISVLLIDLDYFKKINDQYGHIVGDKVLIDFSNILKENFRSSDIIARFGGEEFICLLPNTNEEECLFLVNRLLKKIRENIFCFENFEFNYTASIGINTEKVNHDFSLDKIIKETDMVLYDAKNEGRDRFKIKQ